MIHVPLAISIAFLALAVASLLYTGLALLRVLCLPADASPATPSALGITVFKPLDGLEPELEENLASFCVQTYPRYRVVFCARDPNDPALDVARRLRARFPDCDLAIASGGGAHVLNPKIENLLGALPYAIGEIDVVADSDMRVEPGYVSAIAAAFDDARVGAVTTLYGARATASTVARLGAMYVNDQFTPSVLVATALAPPRFCFGATMAVRASALEEIGGFQALGATIADDYALGDLVSRRGHRVAIARSIPLTLVEERTLGALLTREIRWARTIRAVRPFGYAGSVVAFPILFGVLDVLFSSAPLVPASLLLAALALRISLHLAAHSALRVPGRPHPWLVPLRELLSVVVWAAGFLGPRVRWRQGNYSVRAKGC